MRRRPLILTLIALALCVWGCSQLPDSVRCTTTKVYTQQQLRALFPGKTLICGDNTYTEVNPAFAPKWHSYMGSTMSLLGMANTWNERFDCNRFVLVKLAVINVRYLVDTWNTAKVGDAPAAAEFWYTPDSSKVDPKTGIRTGHAILATIEGGRVRYMDIYSSHYLSLSQIEIDSAYLVKF